MRTLTLILCMLCCTGIKARCQREYLDMPPPDSTEITDDPPADDYAQFYARGIAQYLKKNFAASERLFRKAYKIFPEEEAASHIYYALLYQGYDLEAADFTRRNKAYTYASPAFRRGLESVYTDVGPRISVNSNAGDIGYGDVGAFCRISARTRLWQSATFLQQNQDLGSFKQYEFYASLIHFLKRGWYLSPTFHYDYVPYSFSYTQSSEVNYSSTYTNSRRDTILYKTKATQRTVTTLPGHTQFFNLALPVSKRCGAFFLEAEPVVHVIPGSGNLNVSYASNGTTDSFVHNHLQGTKPFYATGSSARDTNYVNVDYQAGAAITYSLPLRGHPVSLRGAVYYVWDNQGQSSVAYQAGATLWWNKNYRFFINWLSKGKLPLSSHTDGLYYNFNDPIKSRAGITFQLYPLRHFSPLLSYQFEQDTRLQDGAPLVYNSIYLTLKYSL